MPSTPSFRDFLKLAVSLTARIVVWSAGVVLLNAALSHYGPAMGLTRSVGLYVWAFLALVLVVVLFAPVLAKRIGTRQTAVIFVALLVTGAAVYGVVWMRVQQIVQQRTMAPPAENPQP